MGLDSFHYDADSASEAGLLDKAEQKHHLMAAYLKDSIDQGVMTAEDFVSKARIVLDDFSLGVDQVMDWENNSAVVAKTIMRIQMACFPQEKWGRECDGLFGKESWAALKHAAARKHVCTDTHRSEADLLAAVLGAQNPTVRLHERMQPAPEFVDPRDNTAWVGGSLIYGAAMACPDYKKWGGERVAAKPGQDSAQLCKALLDKGGNLKVVPRGVTQVMISGGYGNDLAKGFSIERSVSNCLALVNAYKAAGITPVFTLRMDYSHPPKTAKQHRLVAKEAKFTRELEASMLAADVKVVNPKEWMSENGTTRREYRGDFLHPNSKGYKAYVDGLAKSLGVDDSSTGFQSVS